MFDFIKDNPLLWLIIFLLVVSPSFLFGAMQVFAFVILFVILLIVIGLGVLRWKIRKLQREAQQAQQGQQGQAGQQGGNPFSGFSGFNTSQRRSRSEDDINIVNPNPKKRVADDVGDYVDFEEVKDK